MSENLCEGGAPHFYRTAPDRVLIRPWNYRLLGEDMYLANTAQEAVTESMLNSSRVPVELASRSWTHYAIKPDHE